MSPSHLESTFFQYCVTRATNEHEIIDNVANSSSDHRHFETSLNNDDVPFRALRAPLTDRVATLPLFSGILGVFCTEKMGSATVSESAEGG